MITWPGAGRAWLHAGAPLAARHASGGGSANLWTIVAVLVAAIGSAIVAWQALETHRTTTLSQRALDSSNALAIDSARTRMDQDAPRVDVYVEQVSVLPGGPGASGAGAGATGAGARAEPGRRWRLPEDAERVLQVQALVRVVNLMADRTTHLKVLGMQDASLRAGTEILLNPGTSLAYSLTAAFTLGQWAENWEARQAGQDVPNLVNGCVVSGDDRDEGVEDTWPLRLLAWPIQPAGDGNGAWQTTRGIAGTDWFQIAIRPLRERRYWISQSRNMPLPEPSVPPPVAHRSRKRFGR